MCHLYGLQRQKLLNGDVFNRNKLVLPQMDNQLNSNGWHTVI